MSDFLSVSGGHEIFYETYGNPEGIPVLFLHGGPGTGGIEADNRTTSLIIHDDIVLFRIKKSIG